MPFRTRDATVAPSRVAETTGGVAQLGHPSPIRTIVDVDLGQYDEVWAAAGTWNDVFPIDPRDLQRVTNGVVVEIKRG